MTTVASAAGRPGVTTRRALVLLTGSRRASPRLVWEHRSTDRLEVVLTDRVVGAQAVGSGAPVALPVGRPSTRRVVLVREGGTWLVAEVRGQDSAAASTSRTSSSSKS